MKKDFYISTNKDLLNIDLIYQFLSKQSYWAQERSRVTIEKSIQHSLCFGVYNLDDKQVGFARVVSDYAVFAWLMDVFIIEEQRGKQLGQQLLKAIMDHPDLQGLKRWGLATKDAHGLYEKFGFQSLSKPETMMERI
ncbi:GNAT family N-acetyltransferase [Olivibacter ginsenosidimutans]|uniref:GNAT family N-acetyltransferase n=1 Tax=Olivibacter ginsenosidimutans TaxID=1176537 RepID=A0ABP9AZT4_9SPHI